MNSNPITLEVKPVPDNFPGSVWLPARTLELSETWSKPPGTLRLGDSSTRTLTIQASGLQGAQLPPISSIDEDTSLTGVRFYPGQETLDQTESPSGLTGQRTQSEALVPSAPGQWVLPERVLPWWNTETDTLEYARIPARDLAVTGANIVPQGDLADLPAVSLPQRASGDAS